MTSTWILRPPRAAAIAIVACVLPAVAVGAIPSDFRQTSSATSLAPRRSLQAIGIFSERILLDSRMFVSGILTRWQWIGSHGCQWSWQETRLV